MTPQEIRALEAEVAGLLGSRPLDLIDLHRKGTVTTGRIPVAGGGVIEVRSQPGLHRITIRAARGLSPFETAGRALAGVAGALKGLLTVARDRASSSRQVRRQEVEWT